MGELAEISGFELKFGLRIRINIKLADLLTLLFLYLKELDMSQQLTVTEALSKLKHVKKQIEDGTNTIILGYVATSDKAPAPAGFATQEAFQKEAKSRMDRVRDLVKFQRNLKKAIVKSNASTEVNVGASVMTVAEAIERKNSIAFDKKLVQSLKNGWATLSKQVDSANASLEGRADKFVVDAYGLAAKDKDTDVMGARAKWIETNKAKFVGLDNPQALIEKLEKDVYEFESQVDTALSVKNATTVISVED